VPLLAALPPQCRAIENNEPDHARARGLVGQIAAVPAGLWGADFERHNRGKTFPCRIAGYVPGAEPTITERFYIADHHANGRANWSLQPIKTDPLKKAFQKAGAVWPQVKRVAPVFEACAKTGLEGDSDEEDEEDEEEERSKAKPATRRPAWATLPTPTPARRPAAGPCLGVRSALVRSAVPASPLPPCPTCSCS
jgi:hypothetical protein